MHTLSHLERSLLAGGITHLAGIDEAGRGPLAGPVVAAAVIFTPDAEIDGIDDSKRLSPERRRRLAELIVLKADAVGVGIATVEEIDTMNILQAAILAMHRAVDALPDKPDFLLVDGNRFHHPSIAFRTVVKGDSLCFSIAAASIIAKVRRDAMMDELHKLYPLYGFDRHRGYATRAHIEAICRHGPSPAHRRSFKIREIGSAQEEFQLQ